MSTIFDEYLRRLQHRREAARAPAPPVMPRALPELPARLNIVSYDPLKGLPVIVIGRDPPFVGHYLGHLPEFRDGVEYWRIFVGWYEIWARVLDVRGNPVADLPAIVNGLPSIGLFIAYQMARDIGGSVMFMTVGITEPIDQVVVRKDHIWYLDRVFEGKFRLLICDPAGTIWHSDYDLAVRVNALMDMLRHYSHAVHRLDYENRMLSLLYDIKTAEVAKYRSLFEEVYRDYLTLAGMVDRMRIELDRLKDQLAYWERIGQIRSDLVTALTARIGEIERLLDRVSETVTHLLELYQKYIGAKLEELEKKVAAKPAEGKPEAETRFV